MVLAYRKLLNLFRLKGRVTMFGFKSVLADMDINVSLVNRTILLERRKIFVRSFLGIELPKLVTLEIVRISLSKHCKVEETLMRFRRGGAAYYLNGEANERTTTDDIMDLGYLEVLDKETVSKSIRRNWWMLTTYCRTSRTYNREHYVDILQRGLDNKIISKEELLGTLYPLENN